MSESKFSLRIVPARYGALVMPFLLSIIMTCVVSLVSTLRGAGLDGFTLPLWLSAWVASWIVAFPVLLLALPVVKRLTGRLVKLK